MDTEPWVQRNVGGGTEGGVGRRGCGANGVIQDLMTTVR